MGAITPDAGRQDDQRLVGEVIQGCGLLPRGVRLDELVDRRSGSYRDGAVVGVRSRAVRIFIVGAGLVGARIVSALHAEHELTVVDLEPARLRPLAQRYDVATARASASSGRQLLSAGIADAELVIACTSRDDANLLAGSFARSVARGAKTIVRTSSAEYVEVWQEGRLDVDCVVSDQLETLRAQIQERRRRRDGD